LARRRDLLCGKAYGEYRDKKIKNRGSIWLHSFLVAAALLALEVQAAEAKRPNILFSSPMISPAIRRSIARPSGE
jgi:hypothetical protein